MMRLTGFLAVALAAAPAAAAEVDYAKQVKPLLAARCGSCHGALAQKGKLRLDTAALARAGGRGGPAVVPGKPDESPLVHAVLGRDRDRMPPEGEGAALTAEQVSLLKAWIAAGAKGPADEPVPEDPRKHWAFQKPVRPAVPAGAANPIDGFILAALAEKGLTPPPPADKSTLLRRVTLDLTGLPPTRDHLRAFLADTSPDAYEKVVDRLLASPEYGERWARHWMDVWRYSDWYGRRQANDWRNSSPTQWRWRDWIVGSLNAGKGYDRMLAEMLAADEIAPTDDAAQAATGFLVRNYFSLNFDTWMKHQVEHTAKAFLGLTLNCCHCHDHKYDPIPQEEYFRFRAFFEPIGLRQDRVPGEPDPGPFKTYNYAGSGKVITSGLVRVTDDRPDAKTRMYRLGNDRDFFPDRDPVTPAAPACVGGDRVAVKPVTLPPAARYPGLKTFVREEETARRAAAVAAAKAALAKTPANALATARLAAAEADARSLAARIAADDAKFLGGPGNPDVLARVAGRADREAALAAAEVAVLEAPKGKDAETRLAAAKKAADAARLALAKDSAEYTPLSPVYPATSTGRRKALAEWVASKDNPLTARVAVNHVWARHFGRPLVESVFDFGRNGKPPTHPALLDWLACELMEPQNLSPNPSPKKGGEQVGRKAPPAGDDSRPLAPPSFPGKGDGGLGSWQLKPLHKLIVTSATYRASSAAEHAGNRATDADNVYLWHYPARRLEAEAVRDSLLFVAGDLDAARGGRPVEFPDQPASKRRSLYFTCHPELGGSPKLLEFFDAPDPCDCYRRADTLVPQQALALTNSDFILDRSRSLAALLPADPDAALTAAFETVLTRPPTADERAACRTFLAAQTDLAGKGVTPDAARRRAAESLCRVLFNHHEFVTLR